MITLTTIKLVFLIALCLMFGFVAGVKAAANAWNPETIERNVRRNAIKAEINELKTKMKEV